MKEELQKRFGACDRGVISGRTEKDTENFIQDGRCPVRRSAEEHPRHESVITPQSFGNVGGTYITPKGD
jgi:hypothetical protein